MQNTGDIWHICRTILTINSLLHIKSVILNENRDKSGQHFIVYICDKFRACVRLNIYQIKQSFDSFKKIGN